MTQRAFRVSLWVVAALTADLGRTMAAAPATATLLRQVGVTRGVCALVGDAPARLAIPLVRESDFVVFVQPATATAARRLADRAYWAGLLGKRIFLGTPEDRRLGLADNVADAVIASTADSVAAVELLRVLHPGACAVFVTPAGRIAPDAAPLVKPWPAGIDEWTHHYHGPDNNCQSHDRRARAPYLTQFIALPRYAPAPQNAVIAHGRLFLAFGNVAWHRREEPWLNTLIAVNAFNGTLLWTRPLTPGVMVDRSTLVATDDTLYLGDDKSCKLVDAATGEVKDELVLPAGVADGPFWKWMALDGGVLYALVGKAEPLDVTKRWRRTQHGWPWNGISDGYNRPLYEWGMATTLVALNPNTKQVLWRYHEPAGIDSRTVCMRNGRLYFLGAPVMRAETREVRVGGHGKPRSRPRRVTRVIASFGNCLVCLDARTGKPVWRRTRRHDPKVFAALGPYRPGHGYIGGWKSTVYMKCSDKALYVVGPQTRWLTALSTADGHVLWKYPHQDLHIVLRDDGLYTIGPQNSRNQFTKKLDPLTGKVLASYAVSRRACTRSVGGVDGILFRAPGGTVRLDLAAGKPHWISPMRPSCHLGTLIAGGHLYWIPWVCDCNLQLFGVIAAGPAGDFHFAQPADAQRLQRSKRPTPSPFSITETDWPTYRADNARLACTKTAVADHPKQLWAARFQAQPTAPVAAGGFVFVAGDDGVVHALSAATGGEKWRVYTGGAVRYPPALAAGRAFVGSGDGWVYALDAATGRLLWRFRAAPAPRRIPVYGRLLSTWPVASGVLVEGDTAYFAAGITDYDGTHVYAVEAATGTLRWQNNTLGHLDAFSPRGVACQGELLLAGGRLYLAGGNAVSPGVLDAATGKCLNPAPSSVGTRAPRGRELQLGLGPGPKGRPGPRIRVLGQPLYSDPADPVYSSETAWPDPTVTAANVVLCLTSPHISPGRNWRLVGRSREGGNELWSLPLPAPPVRWGICVDRAGRLLVTLRNGLLLCFG